MRPLNLHISGFQSFTDAVNIDFSGVRAAAIVGHNGAGKSTIIDAIVFALTGQVRTGTLDGAINTNTTAATVQLAFESAGSNWRITRFLRRAGKAASQEILFERQAEDGFWQPTGVSDKSVKGDQELIDQVIGLPGDAILATAIARQGEIGAFAAMKPADRKNLLWNMLGLDVTFGPLYDRAKEWSTTLSKTVAASEAQLAIHDREAARAVDAATEVAAANAALADAETKMTAAEARLAEANESNLTAHQAHAAVREAELLYAQARAERASAVREHAAALTAARRHHDALVERAASLTERHAAHVELAQTTVGAMPDITVLESAEQTASTAVEQSTSRGLHLKNEVANMQAAIAVLDERLASLDRDDHQCFTCGQQMTGDQHATVRATILAEHTETTARIASLDGELAAMRVSHADLVAARRAALGALSAGHEAAKEAAVAAAQQQQAEARAAELASELAAVTAELPDAAAAVATAEQAAEQHATPSASEVAAEAAHAAAIAAAPAPQSNKDQTDEVTACRNLVQQAATRVALAAADLDRVNKAADEAFGLRIELAGVVEDQTTAKTLEKAFGKDGAPALIMEGACRAVTEEANMLLAKLSAGTLSVDVSTKNLQRNGTYGDKLTITVFGPDGQRPIESFSGGERLRVDLALRAALTQVLFARQGTRFDCFISDEGWGALDESGVSAAVEALIHLSEVFGLVLTVTHVAGIAEAMPQRITVNRTPTGSTISTD